MTPERDPEAWTPSTPAMTGPDLDRLLEEHDAVAAHFWAVWDLHDRAMDEAVVAVRARLDGVCHFVRCDMDDPANAAFASRCGVTAIPSLYLFRRGGDRLGVVVGVRPPEELERICVGFLEGETRLPGATVCRCPRRRASPRGCRATFRRWRVSRTRRRRRASR